MFTALLTSFWLSAAASAAWRLTGAEQKRQVGESL